MAFCKENAGSKKDFLVLKSTPFRGDDEFALHVVMTDDDCNYRA